jgi:serine/threonine protein phosphatase PrpC
MVKHTSLPRAEEPCLYLAQDMAHVECYRFASGKAALFTTRAPGKTSDNEDCLALIPCGEDAGVLVVADGLGGMPAGEQASGTAIRSLVKSIQQARSGKATLREAILNGIEDANQRVTELGQGSGTTLAIMEVQGKEVRSYHVGDSMILVTGQRGKIKQQTVSHSPVGYAVEAGFLDAGEAMHHEERHLISNLIGTPDMRMEIGPTLVMAARDTLVLASDGLFDNLHVEEILQLVRKGPLDAVARELRLQCQGRMTEPGPGHPSKPDDLSFILFRLDGRYR